MGVGVAGDQVGAPVGPPGAFELVSAGDALPRPQRPVLGAAIGNRAPLDLVEGVDLVGLGEVVDPGAAGIGAHQSGQLSGPGVEGGELAEAEAEKFRGDKLLDVHFAWAGGIERGQPHYYRIQGPRFLAEYDNTQRDVNHIHSVWRDPEGDFGDDVLAQHRARFHRDG